MKAAKLAASVCAMGAMLLSAGLPAAAQTATYSDIRDAVAAKYFDAATSSVDAADPNRLVIGLDTGLDLDTLKVADFIASPLAFHDRTVADTISFVVTAPKGFIVSKITYTQSGTADTGRTSIQVGTAEWVVAGRPSHLGTFTSTPDLTGTADVSALQLSSVPVSITVSLFASTGQMALTGADVAVELQPLKVKDNRGKGNGDGDGNGNGNGNGNNGNGNGNGGSDKP